MPKVVDIPDTLKPYVWHGVELNVLKDGNQVTGDCPFCGREGKFVVRKDDGRWRCLLCATGSSKGGGNIPSFLASILDLSKRATKEEDLEELAESRNLLGTESLKEWGVCKSVLTDEWIMPGYSINNKLVQLYRYVLLDGKHRLLATPGVAHTMFGVQHFDPEKPTVHITEGPWDGMAWWEMLRLAHLQEGKYKLTSNSEECLYSTINVLSVPGCGTFSDVWCRILEGKEVVLMYDNDHPKTHKPKVDPTANGKATSKPGKSSKPIVSAPAAYVGMKRVTRLLSESEYNPKKVEYLAWGGANRNHDPRRPSGYDIRDLLSSAGNSLAHRVEKVGEVIRSLQPVPEDWVPGRSPLSASKGSLTLDCVPCRSWKELLNDWKKAMKMTQGLDYSLSAMLACVMSTPLPGDQIWLKVVGPPSSGKSTLCEALSVAKKHTVAKSKIKGFHSGYQKDKAGSENSSLINEVKGKTLITKDGDTLLQSPNLAEILAEARDLYDRVSRTHYRNSMGKDWEGINLTWILCGTSALRQLDASELGQRYLDCVVMEGIESEFEREVGRRASNDMIHLLQNPQHNSGRDGESPEMVIVKQKTGGYVNYLCKNASKLISEITISERSRTTIENLGLLVALMRARPSKKQDEEVNREFSPRLIKQLTKMAFCQAAVLNKKDIDKEVLQRVTSIAWDTSRGRSINIVRHLYHAGEQGSQIKTLCLYTHQPTAKEHELLRFLKRINVVEIHMYKPPRHQIAKPYWRLTEYMREIYAKALGEQ